MTMPFRPRWYFFIALVSITFIGPLSIHLFIPAMPAVKEAFGVSTGMAQLTLSLAMLSMAFFTVAYGGLSDRFGRKRVLLGGLVLFTCGAASCMAAANMPMLLAGRILQGAGAGCGVVLARAIARDVYGQNRVAQVIAYLTAAYVLGPMVAPPIGGQLTALFGWRALFVLASAVGLLVILAVAFAVPETRARNAAAPRGVFAGYKSLLRRRRFVGFMLQPGLMSGAFYTQATAASFLAAEHSRRRCRQDRPLVFRLPDRLHGREFHLGPHRRQPFDRIHDHPGRRDRGRQRRAARRLALFRRRLDGSALHPGNLRQPGPGPRHALRPGRRDGSRHRACRLCLGRGGVLAVLLACRAATAHRPARGRYVDADGGGAVRRSDGSPARRLDGGAGQRLGNRHCEPDLRVATSEDTLKSLYASFRREIIPLKVS